MNWHKIILREPTDEERSQGHSFMFADDCVLPDDTRDVLITVRGRDGNRFVACAAYFHETVYDEPGEEYELSEAAFACDGGIFHMERVIAWADFPEPFAG